MNCLLELYQENPELAEEIGRIPDFADNKVSDKDLGALVNTTNYYFESSPKVKEAFNDILNIGIKDKRAYCSPLEAVKWLAEKHEFKEGSKLYVEDPLGNYYSVLGLPWLLGYAWDFSEKERWDDFEKLVNRLSSPELLLKYMRSNMFYKWHSGNIPYSPKRFFKIKRGDCKDLARFATYCLRKNGYDIREVGIRLTPNTGVHPKTSFLRV